MENSMIVFSEIRKMSSSAFVDVSILGKTNELVGIEDLSSPHAFDNIKKTIISFALNLFSSLESTEPNIELFIKTFIKTKETINEYYIWSGTSPDKGNIESSIEDFFSFFSIFPDISSTDSFGLANRNDVINYLLNKNKKEKGIYNGVFK